MISKAKIKWLNSLSHKKFRDAENVFTAEGERLVRDLIPHFGVQFLAAVGSWISENSTILSPLECEIVEVTEEEMRKITQLNTPSKVLCVLERRETRHASSLQDNIYCGETHGSASLQGLVLALDRVQDPGNLGTIIRTADWFGVRTILCSQDTADVYNPKVIQSTMGAIARVNVVYCDLRKELSLLREKGWSVHGTFLDGKNMYECGLKKEKSVIVMGNEGNGISAEIEEMVDSRLKIPSYPPDEPTSESLNVAMATGIILAEFRR